MEKNKIFLYFLILFLVVFIGTSAFLILSNKNPSTEKEKVTTSLIVPTTKPTQGSLNLKLSGNEGTALLKDQEVTIDVVADSNEKNIVGYDLALSYDPLAFDFIKSTSNLTDFETYSYKREGYLSFLAIKPLKSKTTSIFTQTKIASLVFKPMKAGKFSFSLKPLINKDKTDMVTDKTEVINPKLNELGIEVF